MVTELIFKHEEEMSQTIKETTKDVTMHVTKNMQQEISQELTNLNYLNCKGIGEVSIIFLYFIFI